MVFCCFVWSSGLGWAGLGWRGLGGAGLGCLATGCRGRPGGLPSSPLDRDAAGGVSPPPSDTSLLFTVLAKVKRNAT